MIDRPESEDTEARLRQSAGSEEESAEKWAHSMVGTAGLVTSLATALAGGLAVMARDVFPGVQPMSLLYWLIVASSILTGLSLALGMRVHSQRARLFGVRFQPYAAVRSARESRSEARSLEELHRDVDSMIRFLEKTLASWYRPLKCMSTAGTWQVRLFTVGAIAAMAAAALAYGP